jgi:hypothetical protein
MWICLQRWYGPVHNLLMVHNVSFEASEHARLVRKTVTVSPRSIDSESAARNNVGKQFLTES